MLRFWGEIPLAVRVSCSEPSLISRRVIMSCWCVIENKEIYCQDFSWAVDLIVYSILYKVFLNKSFSKYLCYVISFIKNYCVSYSKKLWSCGACLSGDGSAALYVSRDFMSCIFVRSEHLLYQLWDIEIWYTCSILPWLSMKLLHDLF
jgi:hypothetical protein